MQLPEDSAALRAHAAPTTCPSCGRPDQPHPLGVPFTQHTADCEMALGSEAAEMADRAWFAADPDRQVRWRSLRTDELLEAVEFLDGRRPPRRARWTVRVHMPDPDSLVRMIYLNGADIGAVVDSTDRVLARFCPGGAT